MTLLPFKGRRAAVRFATSLLVTCSLGLASTAATAYAGSPPTPGASLSSANGLGGPRGRDGSAERHHSGSPPLSPAPSQVPTEYWLVGQQGNIWPFGGARQLDGAPTSVGQVVDLVPTSSVIGFWLVTSLGLVSAGGDANYYGPSGSLSLSTPVVDLAPTPDGEGY